MLEPKGGDFISSGKTFFLAYIAKIKLAAMLEAFMVGLTLAKTNKFRELKH